ncbi:TonB-dependent receptor plug [Candidatus Filomicrobium marinum]|uniref:TonB-dependent receptor plug n=2 Tax=Filomicrobium TaxID=119044 RepID=A0A0D6JFI9_9HYPH|nr:TonB-dependent receptor [Candidatus Filomicrobium marinum]CFX22034.1 TonB-dependent receptor plug [Candidatus Filomicrobium marinum]CPR18854.1 TonB-dependent receptor plug [Candidatus Filomicrobium marinum]
MLMRKSFKGGTTSANTLKCSSWLALTAIVVLPALASEAALAQEGEIMLPGIVIFSANRTPTDAAAVGSSVSLITQEDLEKQSRPFLQDYLETVPGVNFTRNGPAGSTTGITMRGANQNYVKILIDGMDISDPSAPQTSARFEHLLVDDFARIEILKGSQSTLYGGDAVAGVVSIDTRRATKLGYSQSVAAEYGAYNTWRGATTAGYATDRGDISFSLLGIDTEGFSAADNAPEDDGYNNLTFSGRGEMKVADGITVFFATRAFNAEGEYDASGPVDSPIEEGKTSQFAGRVGTNIELFEGRFKNTFALQGMKIERDDVSSSVFAPVTWYNGDRVKAEYNGVISFNESLSLLAGADWEETGAESFNAPGKRDEANIFGTFAQLMVEPIDNLTLTFGGRIDDHSEFGNFNTHRLTAAYLFTETDTKIRASHSTGFRTPSLNELYGPFGANPDLNPEESVSWDAGIEQGFFDGRATLGVTYFELDTENLIAYTTGYMNVPGVTYRNGVEIAASAFLTDRVAISAAYTFTETERENGLPLPRVPRHNFAFGIDAQPLDKLKLNVTAKYVTENVDEIFGLGIVPLDDYLLLNAKVSYEFRPGMEAYIRGENLLDEDYQTAYGYGTSDLAIYGGLRMDLWPD